MAAGEAKRVLITGVSRFLGLRLAKRLESDDAIEAIVGVDVDEPPIPIKKLEFIRADIQSPLIARVLTATKVDTIVHTNIQSSPVRLGGRPRMKESNVIGTMQLLAAAQRAETVKRVVVKSSTAVYGSGPGEPSILTEDHASRHADLAGYGKDCAEAETYARDFGRRRPDVELVILRTQNVVGPTVKSNISDYLSLPIVPTALGFDPRLQFLHEQDAVDALYRALMGSATGIYNVAGDGVVYLSKAIRLMGAVELPLLLPVAQTTAFLLRRLEVIDFPLDQLKLILFGRVVSTERAKLRLGFAPRYTTETAIKDMRDRHAEDLSPRAGARPEWEKDLLSYLRDKENRQKESV